MSIKTVAEWKKILNISYCDYIPLGQFVRSGERGIVINGIKTEEKHLDIPEQIGNFKVLSIGPNAFSGCKTLESITLPASIQKIESSAFLACTNLSKITFNNENAEIAYNAFQNCPKLADENGFVIFKDVLYGYYGSKAEIEIPRIVRHISCVSFVRNNIVQRIILPKSITEIPLFAFSSMSNLEYVYIPESVTHLGEKIFYNSPKVKIETPTGSIAEKYAKNNNISLV